MSFIYGYTEPNTTDLKISDFPNSVCLEVRSIDLSKDGLNLIFGTYGSEIW